MSLPSLDVHRSRWVGALFSLCLILSVCIESRSSALQAQGFLGERNIGLWWIWLELAVVVYAAVIALLWYALARPRQYTTRNEWFDSNGRYIIIAGGAVIPALVLSIVYFFTFHTVSALNVSPTADPLPIEITGHRWARDVNYLSQDLTTIRQLCAELREGQYDKMPLLVVTQPTGDFASWLTQQTQSAIKPAHLITQRCFERFMKANCEKCPVIKGGTANSNLESHLIHPGSHLTLDIEVVYDSQDYLAGQVINSHDLEPGKPMAVGAEVAGEDLQTLLGYLDTLQ